MAGLLTLAEVPPLALQAQAPAAQVSLDDLFKQGASAYNKGDYATTIARFSEILKLAKPGPALEPVHFTIAAAKLRKGDHAGAIEAFRLYLQTYPNGSQVNDARAGLTTALIGARRMPEALAAIQSLSGLRGGSQGIDDYTSVLGLTLQISDSLLEEKKPADALVLLQNARTRVQVLEAQRKRIQELTTLYNQALAAAGSFGVESSMAANRDALETRLAVARDALKRVEDNTAFDLPRLLRMGRCYLEMEQPWEAIVVYQEILARHATAPDRAYALHGLIFARQAVNRIAQAQELCQRFLVEFPAHPLAAEIATIGGQLALKLQDSAGATAFFGTAIENSQGALRERVIFMLGNARFSARDWPGARESFDRYVREYPNGEWADNAAYRSAVTWILAADYAKAEKAIEAFVAKNPKSTYLPDARYRLAVCAFAYQEYDKTVELCTAWEKAFPTDGLLGEVLSLKGDALKTLEHHDRALEVYLLAASAAASDEVLDYTLNEAARLLEKKKDWARLASVFTTQLDRQPDSKFALGWLYWVARAKARAGQPDEAWDFLAARMGSELGNTANEDVEKILMLMAQIRARQRRPSADAPAPRPPAEQLAQRLDVGDGAPAVSRARVSYYAAKFLQLTRKPAEAGKLMLGIGREQAPDGLSAPLLAEAGEALLKQGEVERARDFFQTMLTRYPRSSYLDFAYVGLGEIALIAGEPEAALKQFNDAIDRAGANNRLREATLGQARSRFALGQFDEAAKLFEQIAATREWRGEATAVSLFYLGQIAVRQGDLPKGIAFFQRVFVSQRRYTEWVAKAYWESGQAFEKLGQTAEAVATYQEMLRNERIQDRREIELARARLSILAPS